MSAPGPFAALYEEYLSPPWNEPGRREREFLDAGTPLALATEYGEVRGWRWKAVDCLRGTVLLVHGWAGRSGTWLVLAPLLNAAGYDVLAYDAPGHGETRGPEGLARTHFLKFAATLLAAGGAEPEPFTAVVGHSFGACAIPYALARGLRANRAVLIAPTAQVASYLPRWGALRELSSAEEAGVYQEWITEFGEEILRETDPVHEARRTTIPALVLHDEGDAEVPVADGRELAAAWPGARFEPTAGLGHRRILLARSAMERVVRYVSGDSPGSSTPS